MVRLSALFKDDRDVPVDPGTVTCNVKAPSGALSTVAVTKDATGQYHADVTASESGTWAYQFVGTGTNKGADEGEFEVRKSRF